MVTVDAAILAAVVAFLLPLRLLSLLARLASTGTTGDLRRPCVAFALVAFLLAAIFALPRDRAIDCPASPTAVAGYGEVRSDVEHLKLHLARLESLWDNNSKAVGTGKGDALEEYGEVVKAMGRDIQSLIKEQESIKVQILMECPAPASPAAVTGYGEVRSDVEHLKLHLARLESLWDHNSKALEGKGDALEEYGEVVEAMGQDIQSLIKEQESIKESLRSSYSDRTIEAMEDKVQILMDESRKMSSDIYNILTLAKDTDKTVEALQSDFKRVQVLTDESRQLNSNVHELWSLTKDTEIRVGTLYSDIEKVQMFIDESRNMEFCVNRMKSVLKQTEKRVEDLYSDIKKGFRQKGIKVPSWMMEW